MADFYRARYCKKCGLEIIQPGECVTCTASSKFCECKEEIDNGVMRRLINGL